MKVKVSAADTVERALAIARQIAITPIGSSRVGYSGSIESTTLDVLKPCPFCVCPVVELCNTHTATYWVSCPDCDAEGPKGTAPNEKRFMTIKAMKAAHQQAMADAIYLWNQR